MKRILPILLTIALLFSLSVPAFAEKQYVTSLFFEAEKDEAYWDRMFERDKEQDWEANGVPKYTAPAPDVPDPTPEQIAQWKEQAQKRLEEEKENDRVNMSLDSEKNTRMMNLVFGDKLNDHSDIPDSTFSGNYQEFTGEDGSTTRVYEDGSVDTKYPDGSWEGLDKLGNHYTENKDGGKKIEFLNGDVGSFGEDGALTVKQNDGSTVTYNPDGTSAWTNDTGLVVEYDEYGTYKSIGFEGGEKVDLTYGQFPPGDQKITGPKGAYIEWHNGNDAQLSEDGTYVVEGDGQYGFTVKGTNGATGKLAGEPDYDRRIDEEATIAKKQETNGKSGNVYTSDTHIGISTMDGGAYDITINNDDSGKVSVVYEDPDGGVHTDKDFGNGMRETSYESADGKNGWHGSLDESGLNLSYKTDGVEHKLAETVVNEDGTVSVKFDGGAAITMLADGSAVLDDGEGGSVTVSQDENGNTVYDSGGVHIVVDKDGNPLEFSADGDYIKLDENGNVLGAHLTNDDGGVLSFDGEGASMTLPDGSTVSVKTDEDGAVTATFPDGTERTKDPNGNWLAEGETADAEGNIYDKDGNLVKGAHDDEGFDDPSKWAKPEAPLTDTPSVPTGDALSRESVTGSYPISGSVMRIREDGSEGTEAFSCTAVIAPVGDDSLSLTIDGTDMGTGVYNESNGTFSVVFDGTEHIACSFRKSGDNVALHLTSTEKTEAGTVTTGTLSGEKNGLTLEAICGTYADVGGSTYRTLDEHWKEIVMSVPEGTTITVFDVGDGGIDFKTSVTGESTGERLRFDPATGVATASYKPEGIAVPMVYTATFKDLGAGKYAVHIVTDWGGDNWLDYHGEKSPG